MDPCQWKTQMHVGFWEDHVTPEVFDFFKNKMIQPINVRSKFSGNDTVPFQFIFTDQDRCSQRYQSIDWKLPARLAEDIRAHLEKVVNEARQLGVILPTLKVECSFMMDPIKS